MEKLIQSFINTIRCASHPPLQNVLVGVSGGADSMVLLHAFLQTQSLFKIQLSVAHINHHLREEDSNQDEELVKTFCHTHSLPLYVHHITPSHWKNTQGSGIEEKARFLRYEYFQTLISQYHFDAVAIGHNLNDLCETFLFNLIRGSSPEKLATLLPVWDSHRHLFRPFLSMEGALLRLYANNHQIPFRFDQSNNDVSYSRNRIRSHILSEILILNPKFATSILRFQSILKEENQWIQTEIEDTLRATAQGPSLYTITRGEFVSFEVALQRRYIVNCRQALLGNRLDFSFSTVEMIRNSILSRHVSNGVIYHDRHLTVKYTNPKIYFCLTGENIDESY